MREECSRTTPAFSAPPSQLLLVEIANQTETRTNPNPPPPLRLGLESAGESEMGGGARSELRRRYKSPMRREPEWDVGAQAQQVPPKRGTLLHRTQHAGVESSPLRACAGGVLARRRPARGRSPRVGRRISGSWSNERPRRWRRQLRFRRKRLRRRKKRSWARREPQAGPSPWVSGPRAVEGTGREPSW